tara:strand:- start:786 stop:1790 length:1005 start_codon:yes stop_codon:yes gene_type:complete
MKKLLVHIGYPKTATTTLQHNFFKTLNDKNAIEWIHGNPHYNDNSQLKFKCEAHIAQITGDGQKDFTAVDIHREKENFKKITNEISVISDESLSFKYPGFSWAYCKDAYDNIDKIKNLFSPYFDTIEIIITARNQQTIIPSFFVQCYKRITKEEKRFEKFTHWVSDRFLKDNNLEIFNYSEMYNACVKAFSKDNVHILLFEDLLYNKEFFYKQLANIFSLKMEDVKELIEVNIQNTTEKSKDVYYKKVESSFHKKIISPIREMIFKGFNESFYLKSQKLYNLLVPKKLREGKKSIKKLTESETDLIKKRFYASNLEFIEDKGLNKEKMELYKYV